MKSEFDMVLFLIPVLKGAHATRQWRIANDSFKSWCTFLECNGSHINNSGAVPAGPQGPYEHGGGARTSGAVL